jgi:hypothetical protein
MRARWGFANLGNFSATYQDVYKETPSHALCT